MNFYQILNSLELGIIYALVALAIFLSFRIIKFSDMTVDGSLSLGAAVCVLLLNNEYSLTLALILSFFAGLCSGLVTSLLNLRFKIMEILAGILTTTALYSINIRIMGKSNLPLRISFNEEEILILIAILVSAISIATILFFRTELGLALRTAGQNKKFALANSINVNNFKIICLSFSNGLISLAGACVALMQGFADVTLGFGTLIIGMISVIIGEKIAINNKITTIIISLFIGSILYRFLVALSLNTEMLNLAPSDLNLITASLVIILMISPYLRNKSC